MMIGILVCLIILAIVGLPWWYRMCEMKERIAELELEHQRYIAELECCYGSEQSFLDIEDDEDHLASISAGFVDEIDDEEAGRIKEAAEQILDLPVE